MVRFAQGSLQPRAFIGATCIFIVAMGQLSLTTEQRTLGMLGWELWGTSWSGKLMRPHRGADALRRVAEVFWDPELSTLLKVGIGIRVGMETCPWNPSPRELLQRDRKSQGHSWMQSETQSQKTMKGLRNPNRESREKDSKPRCLGSGRGKTGTGRHTSVSC